MTTKKKPAPGGNLETGSGNATHSLHSTVSSTLLLSNLMPRCRAALVAKGYSLTQLAELLPATAAAISGILS